MKTAAQAARIAALTGYRCVGKGRCVLVTYPHTGNQRYIMADTLQILEDADAAASVKAAEGLTLFEADAGMDVHDAEAERLRADEEMEGWAL